MICARHIYTVVLICQLPFVNRFLSESVNKCRVQIPYFMCMMLSFLAFLASTVVKKATLPIHLYSVGQSHLPGLC